MAQCLDLFWLLHLTFITLNHVCRWTEYYHESQGASAILLGKLVVTSGALTVRNPAILSILGFI